MAEYLFEPKSKQQHSALSSKADILIYGGAAGGGKTYEILLEAIRNVRSKDFRTVIFRKTMPMIKRAGGIWDESKKIFPFFGGVPRIQGTYWRFPSGSEVAFSLLDSDQKAEDWKGAQVPFFGFDEVTDFSLYQFLYILSRNRSMTGIPGYIRATCNPDPDSWVRQWVDWYIGEDGFPIMERSGKIRWLLRDPSTDAIVWANSRLELLRRYGAKADPKSFTFIPANIYDNKPLMDADPSYLSSLKLLSKVQRERLLRGNWNVKAAAGDYFESRWFDTVPIVSGDRMTVRFWDRAATKPKDGSDPDWTCGVKVSRDINDHYWIEDVVKFRSKPGGVWKGIRNVATQDGEGVTIILEQEPGGSGVTDVTLLGSYLAGFSIEAVPHSKNKGIRAQAASAQCEFGHVSMKKALWNDPFIRELEEFDGNGNNGSHDDQVDGFTGAMNWLMPDVNSSNPDSHWLPEEEQISTKPRFKARRMIKSSPNE